MMMKLFRSARVIHGWLGLFVMPWIVMFGISGFYFHHHDLVLGLLPSGEYDETTLADNRLAAPLSAQQGYAIASGIWPESPVQEADSTTYHGFRAYEFVKPEGRVIVAADTGHYYTKTRYTRLTYSAGGDLLHRKIYWGRVFGTFHELGWLSPRFGTLLADITALALMTFGITGIFMWGFPRYKRYRRRVAEWATALSR
jgi:hypothetical protein